MITCSGGRRRSRVTHQRFFFHYIGELADTHWCDSMTEIVILITCTNRRFLSLIYCNFYASSYAYRFRSPASRCSPWMSSCDSHVEECNLVSLPSSVHPLPLTAQVFICRLVTVMSTADGSAAPHRVRRFIASVFVDDGQNVLNIYVRC